MSGNNMLIKNGEAIIMTRIDWDEYFCEIAKLTSQRSSCLLLEGKLEQF